LHHFVSYQAVDLFTNLFLPSRSFCTGITLTASGVEAAVETKLQDYNVLYGQYLITVKLQAPKVFITIGLVPPDDLTILNRVENGLGVV
jgi:hypothetical protein